MNNIEKKLSKLSSVKIRNIDSSNFIVSLRSRQRIESLRKKRFQSGVRAFVFVALISLITSFQLDTSNFQYDTLDMVAYYQVFENEGLNIDNVFVEVDENDFKLFLIEETVDFDLSELFYFNSFLNEDIEG
jgi:hypothetical protein|tara:strand:- start:2989 stop:3381 length:393 start_codon:yes stop_codon:yes gene_type:complete